MLNPFDLPGPQFLAFYSAFSLLVVFSVWIARRFIETGTVPPGLTNDPLAVACLRGGESEAIQVAVFSLIDRGLLTVNDSGEITAASGAVKLARRPLERKILEVCPGSIATVEAACRNEAKKLTESLAALKLLPDDQIKNFRTFLFLAALFFLWAVAGTKIAIALERGKTNIGFLVLLAGILLPVLGAVIVRHRTSVGEEALAGLRTLFTGLKDRLAQIEAGRGNHELLLAAAVYGTAALSPTATAPLQKIYPRPTSSDSHYHSGSSSSCGSSSCSSSSCGGGGGGCGGCGGGGGD